VSDNPKDDCEPWVRPLLGDLWNAAMYLVLLVFCVAVTAFAVAGAYVFAHDVWNNRSASSCAFYQDGT